MKIVILHILSSLFLILLSMGMSQVKTQDLKYVDYEIYTKEANSTSIKYKK